MFVSNCEHFWNLLRTKERETVQVCMFYWLLAFLRSNWAVWGTQAEMSVTPVIYRTSSVPFTDTAVDPEADLLRINSKARKFLIYSIIVCIIPRHFLSL